MSNNPSIYGMQSNASTLQTQSAAERINERFASTDADISTVQSKAATTRMSAAQEGIEDAKWHLENPRMMPQGGGKKPKMAPDPEEQRRWEKELKTSEADYARAKADYDRLSSEKASSTDEANAAGAAAQGLEAARAALQAKIDELLAKDSDTLKNELVTKLDQANLSAEEKETANSLKAKSGDELKAIIRADYANMDNDKSPEEALLHKVLTGDKDAS